MSNKPLDIELEEYRNEQYEMKLDAAKIFCGVSILILLTAIVFNF